MQSVTPYDCTPGYSFAPPYLHTFRRTSLCLLRNCLLICIKYQLLDPVPRIRIDWMGDITIDTIRRLAARHGDKQPLFSFDYLDVVNCKFIVQGNGHHRLHLTVRRDLANSDICYVHKTSCCASLMPPYVSLLPWRNLY